MSAWPTLVFVALVCGAIYGVYRVCCAVSRWLRRHQVSSALLRSYAYREGTAGWEGPRWRFESERKAERRAEIMRRTAAIRSGNRRSA